MGIECRIGRQVLGLCESFLVAKIVILPERRPRRCVCSDDSTIVDREMLSRYHAEPAGGGHMQ
jgi:hypothetical protein